MLTCLGSPTSAPRKFEDKAAELFSIQQFAEDSRRRMPDREVLSQLSYMGVDNVFQTLRAGPMITRGNKVITAVNEALASDFKNWVNRRGQENQFGHRKPDALAVSPSLRRGELLEVSTVAGRSDTQRELRDKLEILKGPVNEYLQVNHGFRVDWYPTPWRPAPAHRFMSLPAVGGEQRWICLEPTFRHQADTGVVLYEIHAVSNRVVVPLPIPLRDELAERVRNGMRSRAATPTDVRDLGRLIGVESPAISPALRAIQTVAGVAAAVAAVVLVLTPILGDEVLCAALAGALINNASD